MDISSVNDLISQSIPGYVHSSGAEALRVKIQPHHDQVLCKLIEHRRQISLGFRRLRIAPLGSQLVNQRLLQLAKTSPPQIQEIRSRRECALLTIQHPHKTYAVSIGLVGRANLIQ